MREIKITIRHEGGNDGSIDIDWGTPSGNEIEDRVAASIQPGIFGALETAQGIKTVGMGFGATRDVARVAAGNKPLEE